MTSQKPAIMTAPICLFSGPRNISTALMYSFAQRGDMRVIDEPLYGHYLRITGAPHPGRETVISSMNCDGDSVMRELMALAIASTPVHLFMKHMTHHLVDLDLSFLTATRNVFLIRDPRDMLPSLTVQLPQARLADTGLERQWQLYTELVACGQRPAILDARELLTDPNSVLRQLCTRLGLEFSTAMLSWEAGSRPEDGVWAPYWYHSVHASTGFGRYTPKTDFPAHLESLLADCEPWYEKLFAHAIYA